MFAAYLFATILGGVFLVASVAMGHHGSSHGGGHADSGHGEHAGSVATVLGSLRFWTYLLAFGGATGLLLHAVVGAAEPLAALLAAAVGGASGVTAQVVLSRLGSQVGGTVRTEELVGRTGRLLLPAGKGKTGRVRLNVKNATVDLIATTDDADLESQEEVLVVDVKDGVAQVTRNPAKEK